MPIPRMQRVCVGGCMPQAPERASWRRAAFMNSCDREQACGGAAATGKPSLPWGDGGSPRKCTPSLSLLQHRPPLVIPCRGGLWRKGDTSGAVQELLSIALDCDSDAVLFTVRQRGDPPAFCHLNTRTCWGEAGGLN